MTSAEHCREKISQRALEALIIKQMTGNGMTDAWRSETYHERSIFQRLGLGSTYEVEAAMT